MVSVQYEDAIHRPRQGRADLVFLARHGKAHVQEILGIPEGVLRIDKGLAERIFERHGGDRRHLGNQAIGGDHPLVRIMDVGRVVIEGGQCADHPAQHRHRVRVAPEAAEKGAELLVHHRVMGDVVDELLLFLGGRQFAVQQQVGDLHEVAFPGQLLDRIAAVEKDAFVAVDIGNAGATGRRRHEAGVVGEISGQAVEHADSDDLGPDRSFDDRQLDRLAAGIVGQRHRPSRHHDVGVVAVHRCTSMLRP